MSTQNKGKLALIVAAFIWGISFTAVQQALNVGWEPFSLLGTRGLLAGVAIGLFGIKSSFWKNKILMRDGIIAGFLLTLGMALQTIGQNLSTVQNASFITVLYVVFIPMLMWKKHKLSVSMMIAIVFAVMGTAILSLNNQLHFQIGDLFVVGAAFVFAVHIIFMTYLARHNDVVAASSIQSLTMAVLSFGIAFFLKQGIPSNGWQYVLYAGLMSSGLAFLLQMYGQTHVHPTVSGLLLTLESLFGALGAILILHESLTLKVLLGGSLMMLSVVMVELGPQLIRLKQKGD